MVINHKRCIFISVLLIFIFVITGIHSSVFAQKQLKEASIVVIGNESQLLKEKSVKIDENTTALDLLKVAIGEENVEITESDYGKMITSILGLETKDTYFWSFYVNGISAQVGVDSYNVQQGDVITFSYEDWNIPPINTVSLNVIGNEETVIKELKDISFTNNPSAFQLLRVVMGTDNLKYSDSQYGKMITSIGGLRAEDPFYWAFYVNGEMASVGPDSFIIKNGDEYTFQYESWDTQLDASSDNIQSENSSALVESRKLSKEELEKIVNDTSDYVLSNQIGEWEAIALSRAGKTLPNQYIERLKDTVEEKKATFRKVTELERYILGFLSAGEDPTNVVGENLVEYIYNGELTKQGLNGVIYALIVLNSANFEVPKNAVWTKDKLVHHLIENQNDDGGWTWDGSTTSDMDTTAMVLTSLSVYQTDESVSASINRAISYLSQQYKENGVNNSSTAAQMIIALSSLGIDSNSGTFTHETTSLIYDLLTYQNDDGGFDWQGGDESDAFSTGQAFQAIVAYKLFLENNQPLYSFTNSDKEIEEDQTPSIEEQINVKTTPNAVNYLTVGIMFITFVLLFVLYKRKIKTKT